MSDKNDKSKHFLDAAREALDWTWDNVTDEALNYGFSSYDPEAKERDARKATVEALDQVYAGAWSAIESEKEQVSARATAKRAVEGGVLLRVFFRVGGHSCVVRLWHPGTGDFAYAVVPDAGGAVPAVWPVQYRHDDPNAQQYTHTQSDADSHDHSHVDSSAHVDLQPHS